MVAPPLSYTVRFGSLPFLGCRPSRANTIALSRGDIGVEECRLEKGKD